MHGTEHMVIPDASALSGWQKSGYSGDSVGNCLEISTTYPAGVPVRDSKNPHGPALVFPRPIWLPFVTAFTSGGTRSN
ncbi:hypothetical protein GCM10020367_10300 [Streptomyces sannanensis]|uniref:DUF397 domain-containing protein n=1 Tax=Streptomyces sannanensis TaxID=285536 RepID=A0ABP6S6F7_9ACTN